MSNFSPAVTVTALLLSAGIAAAQPTPAVKCEASKNKVAAGYFTCLQKETAKGLSKGITPDYSSCSANFDKKWDNAEAKGETMCPDSVAAASMNAHIASQATATAAIVAGAAIPICGDGIVNAVGEQCDGADLAGLSCQALSFDVGNLGCSNACELVASGCRKCEETFAFSKCWYLGKRSESCTTTCSAHQMSYDPMTETVAGSGGLDSTCQTLIASLVSAPPATFFSVATCSQGGLGCAIGYGGDFWNSTASAGRRCHAPTTTAGAFDQDFSRVCACTLE